MLFDDFFQEIEAVEVGHVPVAEHQPDVGVGLQRRQPLHPVAGLDDVGLADGAEGVADDAPHGG